MLRIQSTCLVLLFAIFFPAAPLAAQESAENESIESIEPIKRIPEISGAWWTIASNPDLGELTTAKQQPVDFAIWQDAKGSWNLWSCIRNTAEPGKTRLFHGWQTDQLTDTDWQPTGVTMQADSTLGETRGGLQAPYVLDINREFLMFYGDWQNIAIAQSPRGVNFKRIVKRGIAGVFGGGPRDNTRDAMVIQIDQKYYCYYTKSPDGIGAIYCRTSTDLEQWSFPVMVCFGGQAGMKGSSLECPYVVNMDGYYYLFATQRYLGKPVTSVYRSLDPRDFGIDDDSNFIGTLPIAAPELIQHKDQWYIAALNVQLDGIRIAPLQWTEQK